jgi:hypothetical protein
MCTQRTRANLMEISEALFEGWNEAEECFTREDHEGVESKKTLYAHPLFELQNEFGFPDIRKTLWNFSPTFLRIGDMLRQQYTKMWLGIDQDQDGQRDFQINCIDLEYDDIIMLCEVSQGGVEKFDLLNYRFATIPRLPDTLIHLRMYGSHLERIDELPRSLEVLNLGQSRRFAILPEYFPAGGLHILKVYHTSITMFPEWVYRQPYTEFNISGCLQLRDLPEVAFGRIAGRFAHLESEDKSVYFCHTVQNSGSTENLPVVLRWQNRINSKLYNLSGGIRSNTEEVRRLLSLGADASYQCASSLDTALIRATWWKHVDTVQLLLDNGADKTAVDRSGKRAFDYATEPLQDRLRC